ncbi:MAG: CopG family transcriptional regulator [Ignavibacteria bacterium]|nr:CopG family transcriptional regulator [Ignavibacteria bacterium]
MSDLSKRAMVYFGPAIHWVLKVKVVETSASISDIIDKEIRQELLDDEDDLRVFKERVS